MPAASDDSRPSGDGLARLVRSYRFRAGLSQESLARASKLSPRTIRKLESGRALPRASTIRELADALDLTDDERRELIVLAHPETGPAEPERDPAPNQPVVPRHLPAAPRGFVGREVELGELTRSVEDKIGPLWCITGAGGIGKTWLCLHWAHGSADRFPDGQLYVNLRGFEPDSAPVSVESALRRLLYALNVEPATIPDDLDSRAGLYRSLLADKRVLVVLDDARETEQVTPLLPGAPGCTIVVTSRGDLAGLVATHGARQQVLDTFDDSDTVRMLRTHVGAARTAAEPAASAELSRFCAGLPLAMGILAARAAANPKLPLSELAARLRSETDRLDALDSGDISTSLRGVLGSSYRLGPDAARVFRVLGLVPASDIGLHAVASLAGEPAERVRGLLRELEVARLVEQHVPGRYRIHDLTHLYAAERARHDLTERERDEARIRVIDHYLHTADAGAKLIASRLMQRDYGPAAVGAVVDEFPDAD